MGESVANYIWLYKLFEKLCDEYTFRYGKIHSTDAVLRGLLMTPPTKIKEGGLTTTAQAFRHCKKPDSVDAYRTYYIQEKKRFAKWTKRQVPHWFWAVKEFDYNIDYKSIMFTPNDDVIVLVG